MMSFTGTQSSENNYLFVTTQRGIQHITKGNVCILADDILLISHIPKDCYKCILIMIPSAANEMREKRRMRMKRQMRMKREALVSFFERSDEAAWRVFANQLAIIKY